MRQIAKLSRTPLVKEGSECIISVARAAAVMGVLMAAMIALMIYPNDDAIHWTEIVIASKAVAILGFYVAGALLQQWKHDALISAYLKWCKEVEDTTKEEQEDDSD